jgi:hypothetical protein
MIDGVKTRACLELLAKDVGYYSNMHCAVDGAKHLLIVDVVWAIDEVSTHHDDEILQSSNM